MTTPIHPSRLRRPLGSAPTIIKNFDNEVVVSKEKIARRIKELGQEITAYYRGNDRKLTIIAVLSSSMVFTADLMRCIECDLEIGWLRAVSYVNGEKREVMIDDFLPDRTLVGGKDVLLIDGVSETGSTLIKAREMLLAKPEKPRDVRTCVLLSKRMKDESLIRELPDFCGFSIPDILVRGFGINHLGIDRHLPNIKTMSKAAYAAYASRIENQPIPEPQVVNPTAPITGVDPEQFKRMDQLLEQINQTWRDVSKKKP